VGRKTANLVLSVAFGKPAICVDTHVHRITNRWGLVATKTPEETERELQKKLPQELWGSINKLLVLLGQNICLPRRPHCSRCPVAPFCKRQGVTDAR
jgi:endonuclease-3